MSTDRWMDSEKVRYMFIFFFLIYVYTQGNPAICENMEEPGRHGYYANWNKLDREI